MEPFMGNSRVKADKDRNQDRVSVSQNRTWYQSPRADRSLEETKNIRIAEGVRMSESEGIDHLRRSDRLAANTRNNRIASCVRRNMQVNRKEKIINRNLHRRKIQNFNRSVELASLLRGWNLGGEIGKKRNRISSCYRCFGRGHLAWECPMKRSSLHAFKSVDEEDSRTLNMGIALSHEISPLQPFIQKYVERTTINGDYLVEGSDKGTWNSIWYVNTRISKHMTPNHDLFTNFKNGFSINKEDHHEGIAIHGVGEIELESDGRVFSIPYVSYAPGININVLSLKQLILQGFEFEIKDLKGVITHMCVNQRRQEDDQNESTSRINTEINQGSNEIEDGIEIEGKIVPLIVETFDDFISFMVLVNCDKTCYKNKDYFVKKFEKAIGWFQMMKTGEVLALPPKIAGLDVHLFDFYKLVMKSGGREEITKKNEWSEMAMSFGYPECYGKAFNELFDQYLLIPQEHYEFGLKRFGRIPSIDELDVGGVTNRFFTGNVGSEGGVTRSQDQDDQNIADTRSPDQIQAQNSEEEDPSIVEYYSDENVGDSSKESDDFVIIL